MERCDVLVVGAGAAGMAAALAAAEAGASVVLADREDRLGGVLPQCLHRGFGLAWFGEDLTGAEYARRFARRIEGAPVKVLTGTSVLALGRDRTALLTGAETGALRLSFRRAVLAAGCRETPFGALGAAGDRPSGIFTAGEVQRLVNLEGLLPGREIVVLGGGDVGLVMAGTLARRGCHVAAVVERGTRCGGLPRHFRESVLAHAIPLLTRATVTAAHGRGRLREVTVRHLDTGAEERLPCDTLITALGLTPERELLAPLGEPLPPWVSLCGNCEHVHRVVDTVTAQGAEAGRRAARGQQEES